MSRLKLLRNANVFAPEPLGRCDLLVAGEKLVYLGPDAPALPAAFDVEESDLGGLRLIPGLIDGHAHVIGGGGEAGFRSRVPPLAVSRFTSAGITSVIGLLGTDDLTRSPGELLAHTRGLIEEGISAWCLCGGYHLPPATITGSVRGDIVHIDRIIGVGELALSDHRSSQPRLSELTRVAGEAHVAGLMSGKAGIVHLHLGDGERGLELVERALEDTEIPARVFNPTHVNRRPELFEQALGLAERGCTIDVTAYPSDPDDAGLGASEAVARYLQAGLPAAGISVSSDGGGCLPTFDTDGRIVEMDVGAPAALLRTLRELLERGFTLEQTLPAFTSNVADLLRLPEKGRLQAGADADLLTLDEHGNLRDCMARGRWHVREGQQRIHGMFETRDGGSP